MCAAFTLRPSPEQIRQIFDLEVPADFYFDQKILPYAPSLIVLKNSSFELRSMSFSLIPSWSKEPKVKFATHNARLETLQEKPTWRNPLKSHRCLVPISQFIEPIYTGALAGNMIAFGEQSGKLLVAAGLWDSWVDKTTGEVKESFAIITSDPPPFIEEMGHDRCPVFLSKEFHSAWLDTKSNDSKAAVEILHNHQEQLNFVTSVDRPLAKGWEKRIK